VVYHVGPRPHVEAHQSEQDDRDAWSAIADHAGASSGGQLKLLKPPVGYILTSATGAQLASYGMGAGEYTGPIEFIFSVLGADGSLATTAIDEFVADVPSAFAELGSIERSCFDSGD
jgi:hypothetical protein